MNETRLEIYTLGHFQVKKGGINLSEKYSGFRKPWKLLKYLITESGNFVSGEMIIEALWPEAKIENPKHVLSNLVYRLRRMLADGEKDSGEYIVYSQGYYFLNLSNPIFLDILEIENLVEQARKTKNKAEKIRLLQKAKDLYRGEYLPGLMYEDWTRARRYHCQKIHLEISIQLGLLLRDEEKFSQLIDLCEELLEKEPFEEKMHRLLIEGLIHRGEKLKARNYFQHTKSFFRKELGVELSFSFEQLERGKSFRLQDMSSEEAFYCDCETFRALYELEKRRAERKKNGLTIIEVELFGVKAGYLEESTGFMEKVLLSNLRKGDVVCQRSLTKFILLLADLFPERADRVLERIEKEFNQLKPGEFSGSSIRCKFLTGCESVEAISEG